jgi:lipopolysaccharide heptosyltransferase I
MSSGFQILIVRLGAMGDILHTLPALRSLRLSFQEATIHWAVASKWKPLLEGNPDVDNLILVKRRNWKQLRESWRFLRPLRPRLALDFQGLIQSALIGRASHPETFYGWHGSVAREPLAARLYSHCIKPAATHVVDKNLELAAVAGATKRMREFYIPQGRPEGALPRAPFVLANPFAGWTSKQWPFHNYPKLAERLRSQGLSLVANVPLERAGELNTNCGIAVHTSSLEGLIDATRRATAVVGVDSGPMHLAAALEKPGVALFGPTDPARNGPYGGTMTVLRSPSAVTTYKRKDVSDPSMQAIGVDEVYEAILKQIAGLELRS